MMQKDRIPSFALGVMIIGAALIFWIPVLVRPIAKATINGTPEQWLGFAGNIVGSAATLLAAGIALFAAYRTIKPVREQLAELIKQNDHIAYDKLRRRAIDLNEERLLILKIRHSARGINKEINRYMAGANNRATANAIKTAIDGYGQMATSLQDIQGNVWGNKNTQQKRDRFNDMTLACGLAASAFHQKAENPYQGILITIKSEFAEWEKALDDLGEEAKGIGGVIASEVKRTQIAIGRLDDRLFE